MAERMKGTDPGTMDMDHVARLAAEKAVREVMVKVFQVDPDKADEIRSCGDDMRWVREQRASVKRGQAMRDQALYALLGGAILAALSWGGEKVLNLLHRGP